MRSTFAPLLVVASFLGSVVGQALTINTPTPAPVVCQPTLITWGGGTPPYFIVIVDGDDHTNVLVNFGELSNTSITWTVKEPVGQNLLLTIKDQTGLSQSSATFLVAAGGSTACLTASSSGSAPASGSTSASASGSVTPSSTVSTTSAASTTAASTTPSASSTRPASSTPASSAASSSAPPASSTPSGGAAPTGVPVAAAAAAAIGAVFAALL
ncbi:hypothetical protein C8R43DRAFT_96162 [Mycena crocata]|nr:hypothetical protein C8R43DRAFT_96162 [Mycena crocata]